MTLMDEDWDTLVKMLRSEIEGYGKLFRILEGQRECLLNRDLEGLVRLNEEIGPHTDLLEHNKRSRESLVDELWTEAAREGRGTVRKLIREFPNPKQPLMEELLGEVNRLVEKSRQQLQRNQMLFTRSKNLTAQYLKMLQPDEGQAFVYQRNGHSRSGSRAVASRYLNRA